MRRLISHAFSEKALAAQETLLMDYVTQFVDGLKRECAGLNQGKVDISKWYNFTTFDVIGDLAFAEPFGCVRNGEYHQWVYDIFARLKVMTAMRTARFF